MYKMTYQVLSSQVDSNSELKPLALVNILQDCEGLHIDGLKLFSGTLKKEGIGIFLSYRQMNIHKMPKLYDTLYIETFPYETKGYFGYRNTIIYNEKRELLISTYCLGTFTSLKTLRPTRVVKEALDTLDEEPRFDMNYLPRKIEIGNLEEIKKGHDIYVTKLHIDVYQHMNNSFYVGFAEGMMPNDFKVKMIRVEYRTPVILGEIITPYLYKNSEGYIVLIKNQINQVCAIVEFR